MNLSEYQELQIVALLGYTPHRENDCFLCANCDYESLYASIRWHYQVKSCSFSAAWYLYCRPCSIHFSLCPYRCLFLCHPGHCYYCHESFCSRYKIETRNGYETTRKIHVKKLCKWMDKSNRSGRLEMCLKFNQKYEI